MRPQGTFYRGAEGRMDGQKDEGKKSLNFSLKRGGGGGQLPSMQESMVNSQIKALQACNIPRHGIFSMQRKSF